MQPTGRTSPIAQTGERTTPSTTQQPTGTGELFQANASSAAPGGSNVSDTERQRQILDEHSAHLKGQMQDAVRQALSQAGLDPDNMFRPGRAVTFTAEQMQLLTSAFNNLAQQGSRVEELPDA